MRVVTRALWVVALCASGVSVAQTTSHRGSHSSGSRTADLVEGEVQMVDRKARNITLRHAEIRNVQMPAMTMVFNVKEAALLDRVKAGDKVRFKVEPIDGAPTVTVIELVE